MTLNDSGWRERARRYPAEAAVEHRVECHPQLAVIIVAHSNKAERLHAAFCRLARGHEHLGHTVHRARLSLKPDFDEVAAFQGARYV
jgi:hypothetical protein